MISRPGVLAVSCVFSTYLRNTLVLKLLLMPRNFVHKTKHSFGQNGIGKFRHLHLMRRGGSSRVGLALVSIDSCSVFYTFSTVRMLRASFRTSCEPVSDGLGVSTWLEVKDNYLTRLLAVLDNYFDLQSWQHREALSKARSSKSKRVLLPYLDQKLTSCCAIFDGMFRALEVTTLVAFRIA